jgi:hypothetical protein
MSQRVTTFDPDNVTVIFGIPLTGFADGTHIKITKKEDDFTLKVGVDGEAVRSKNNNLSSEIELTFMQSSLSNQYLAGVYNADRMTPSGDGILPLLIKDNSGTSSYAAEKAWIVKAPDTSFGKEPENRVWKLETNAMVHNVGGSL